MKMTKENYNLNTSLIANNKKNTINIIFLYIKTKKKEIISKNFRNSVFNFIFRAPHFFFGAAFFVSACLVCFCYSLLWVSFFA